MSENQMYFEYAPYSDLCGCVSVCTSEKENKMLSNLEASNNPKLESFKRSLFSKGRDRNYLSNCQNCDSGIRHKPTHTEAVE